MDKRVLLILLISNLSLYCDEYIDDISKAKVGECYKKVVLPAKYETKEELIEVSKASKKLVIQNPMFKSIKEKVEVESAHIEIKDTMAKFETKKQKFPINDKKIYYTIGKKREIALKDEFVEYLKKQGLKLESLKVGECYIEYAKIPAPKKIKKNFIKKQAYEILDVEPPKYKIIKKKIEIKPAYTKIIKTPAIYETKVEKILVEPAKKEYVKDKNGIVCIKEKPAVYKSITKKILKSPPTTKVIKFPPTYKEIEVKVYEDATKVSRRVVPQKNGTYDFFVDQKPIYFWEKEDKKVSDANTTGLKICKKLKEPKYITKDIEVVIQPATTNRVKIPAKLVEIERQKLIKDANVTAIPLPAQYEKIKTKVMISPEKVVWKRVECKSKDQKSSAVR